MAPAGRPEDFSDHLKNGKTPNRAFCRFYGPPDGPGIPWKGEAARKGRAMLLRRTGGQPIPRGEKTMYMTTTTPMPTAAQTLPVFQGVMSMTLASGISQAVSRGQTLMHTA